MTDEVVRKEKIQQPLEKFRELLNKHSDRDPDMPNPKRMRFFAYLKSQYGYTNEKAIDELERLLKQFDRSNQSLGIGRSHRNYFHPQVDPAKARK
jgi:hypothetical protein